MGLRRTFINRQSFQVRFLGLLFLGHSFSEHCFLVGLGVLVFPRMLVGHLFHKTLGGFISSILLVCSEDNFYELQVLNLILVGL